MKLNKPIFADSVVAAHQEREQRQLALEYIAEAWNAAEDDGLESESLSHAALFAALASLVRAHGEEMTAELVATLPDRIRAGEYSLDRSLQ